MATLTIEEYLKYANLQLAAEAFLIDKSTKQLISSGNALVDALKEGNKHSSRFSESEAIKFASQYEVKAHLANTGTGFSGTLFFNKDTDEYTLSFRSTEFVDDAVRDSESTNVCIKNHGFAFGQLADMENWYQQLKTEGKLPDGVKISVTGYSLGGHLATAFNLMHAEVVEKVVTFNGAGIGSIGDPDSTSLSEMRTKLPEMIGEFNAWRASSSLAGEISFHTGAREGAKSKMGAVLTLCHTTQYPICPQIRPWKEAA